MKMRRWLVAATLMVALLAQGPTVVPVAQAAAAEGREIRIRVLKDVNIGPGQTVKLRIKVKLRVEPPSQIGECAIQAPVRFQRWDKQNQTWQRVGRATTNDRGVARANLKHRLGRYRAVAPRQTVLEGIVCRRAVDMARHVHD